MDFIFCLPIIFGCPTKIKPDGDQTPRICPRCHNASVVSAKSRRWFELFWVPLIPFKSNRVWLCGICQWSIPIQPGGWEPQLPSNNFLGAPPGAPQHYAMSSGPQQGYQPEYIDPNRGAYQPGYIDPSGNTKTERGNAQ